MNAFKSYFAPTKASGKKKSAEKSVELKQGEVSPTAPINSPWQDSQNQSNSGFEYPVGDFRNAAMQEVNDIKCDVMVNWLQSQQMEKLWSQGGPGEGVVLKKSRDAYTCSPPSLMNDNSQFLAAIKALNVRVAMTVNTRVIKILLHNNTYSYVEIEPGLRLQVLPTISALPRCQKHQFAAFIEDSGLLVVWEDQPRKMLERCEKLESALLASIWKNSSGYPEEDEKKEPQTQVSSVTDSESLTEEQPRRVVLIQPVLTAITIILAISAMGGGWRRIAIEVYVDGNYIRLALLAAVIPQLWLSLFFFQALTGNVAQLIGPVDQMRKNTKFYSGIPPKRLDRSKTVFPHITIQCPVYKEGLHSVIEPTIRSIKAAISTYEMQGGTANIFVNDDGMQLISEADARARQDFYDEHNIGWVARPAHNPKGEGDKPVFHRRGKFKKASNMNYALWVSNRVEEKLEQILHRTGVESYDQDAAYTSALAEVVAEDDGQTWAEGNIRMGDYILLIDSDTRVPVDCFLDAVSEMEQSPEVAIIQFSSGVMNVTDSFFENGITFFTNLVYTQIQYAVANGDVAPFVGHNAILRWSALQEVSYHCTDDVREKFWSEATVSEDFDMALRLQTTGYLVRLAAYNPQGFKEGVSLTVYDELARWEKYAYGCNELIFHPFSHWPKRGPLTPLFKRFITSSMPLPSKLTILAYIGTYYALGSAWLLTLLNYFLTGWFNGHLDHYYIDSFKIYFAIIVVFTALGNIALAALRYRTDSGSLIGGLVQNFKWVPLLIVFLGGVSIHVSQALASHFLGVDMSWGATAKEAEKTTFFEEIPRVLKRFKWTFAFCTLCAGGMVVLKWVVPVWWRIEFFTAIWPLATCVVCHFLLPVGLNPNLMLFTW
ncbi:hypothetical protein M501DRAFT_968140 [Patellaria atrata CBS 101060]|uniref:Glycosyltransferase 2-like domain-containing protein n=1 Tax=Patellaria atrata CBS 101060 TaxID=1346257 RepID=A0A9P4SGA9_9PEZI|nr:hypothetical protein M501DRAFT_968140 [Patellaria atrata CBS 101060]